MGDDEAQTRPKNLGPTYSFDTETFREFIYLPVYWNHYKGSKGQYYFLELEGKYLPRYTVNLHNKVTFCGYQLHLALIYFN